MYVQYTINMRIVRTYTQINIKVKMVEAHTEENQSEIPIELDEKNVEEIDLTQHAEIF